MFKDIQFTFGKGPRDFVPVREGCTMAMRSTDGTLDFIFREPGGKERVAGFTAQNRNATGTVSIGEKDINEWIFSISP